MTVESAVKAYAASYAFITVVMASACSPIADPTANQSGCGIGGSQANVSPSGVTSGLESGSSLTGDGRGSLQSYFGSRLAALSAVRRNDLGARQAALALAIADVDRSTGASDQQAEADQQDFRIDLLLGADADPSLESVAGYGEFLDSIAAIPGVRTELERDQRVFAAGRRLYDTLKVERGGAFLTADDTIAIVGALLNIGDSLSDSTTDGPGDQISEGWAAYDEAVAVLDPDSTTTGGLVSATEIGDTTVAEVWPEILEFWENGGTPEYSVVSSCPAPLGSGNYMACPVWCIHVAIHAVGMVIAHIAAKIANGTKPTTLGLEGAAAAGEEEAGVALATDVFADGYTFLLIALLFDVSPPSPPGRTSREYAARQ